VNQKLLENPEISNLIKSGEIVLDQKTLKDKDFALIIMTKKGESLRKFPINSSGSTLSSAICFAKNKDKLPKEACQIASSNIVKAMEFFDLSEKFGNDIQETVFKESEDVFCGTNLWKEKEDEKIVKESSHKNYALNYKNGEEVINKYPIDTAEQVKEASDRFDVLSYSLKDDPLYKRQMAWNIKKAADEMKIRVSSEIEKYASDEYSPLLKDAIDRRVRNCSNPEHQKLYNELYEKRADVGHPLNFAKCLEILDKEAGIDKLWNKLGDSYFVTLGSVSEDYLNKKATSDVVNEKLISLSKDSTKMAFLKKSLPDICDKFAKDPVKTFNGLPLSTRSLIAEMA